MKSSHTLTENPSQDNTPPCPKCHKSPWVHYMAPARKGSLFCDDGLTTAGDFPLAVIAETFQTAGRKIPAKLAEQMRKLR